VSPSTPKILLSLQAGEDWSGATEAGPDAVAVLHRPIPPQRTREREERAPASPAAARRAPASPAAPHEGVAPEFAAEIERLIGAGVQPLGYVSLAYATRPLPEILDDITRWALLPVLGVFLDHAPAGPYQIGPVVQAVRASRRCGLASIVLNPGGPVDPLYRRLGVTICTFEGSWERYAGGPLGADEAEAGDGHLVFGVPPHEWDTARTLSRTRHAGLALITDRPAPH
jgi:hypothetical protein